MSQITLAAEPRTPGAAIAKQLRANDRVPGVYYTQGQEAVHFSVSTLALRPVVYTAKAQAVRLSINGQERLSILKEVTFDPISDKILHFDLLGVREGEPIIVKVPVHITGLAIGVREGGTMEHALHKTSIKVDPANIPTHIDVDVSGLGKGENIHISDINIPGVEFLERPGTLVAACHAPKVVAVEETAAPTKKKK
ncbi:MAG: 50S ribosomal protein L25 [Candidatus Kapabacteria bacterium]|nr:50S ribosomal protein L25 [Candidatus Kapabacteria bacterium]